MEKLTKLINSRLSQNVRSGQEVVKTRPSSYSIEQMLPSSDKTFRGSSKYKPSDISSKNQGNKPKRVQ